MTGLGAAIGFLTRIPVGASSGDSRRLARGVPWFSVVGALVGAIVAAVFAGAGTVLPAFVAASLAVGTGLLVTGAFHEDGLGDTADALVGGWTREERLRILRDPRLGTFGVCAVVVSLLLRTSAVASMAPWDAAAALVAAHALARVASIGLISFLPAASDEGLGAGYAAAVRTRHVLLGALGGLLIAGSVLGIFLVPSALAAVFGASVMGLLAKRRIGGLTGDILGAAEQTAETLVLLLAASAATNGWASVAWWR
ncbi:MAG: adenosylcobinamide-GDP ribazoletransferase [Actinomycetota bacterium]